MHDVDHYDSMFCLNSNMLVSQFTLCIMPVNVSSLPGPPHTVPPKTASTIAITMRQDLLHLSRALSLNVSHTDCLCTLDTDDPILKVLSMSQRMFTQVSAVGSHTAHLVWPSGIKSSSLV